jgi:hypothetical protein
VGKKSNIIEINGRHYDAETGTPVKKPAAKKTGQPVDGIVVPASKQKAKAKKQPAKVTSKKRTKPVKAVLTLQDVVRVKPRNLAVHIPEQSKTLMRKIVEKPARVGSVIKAQSRIDLLISQPSILDKPKLPAVAIDDKRLKHAVVTPKSKFISRFSPNLNKAVMPQVSTDVRPLKAFSTPSLSLKQPERPQTTADLLNHAVEQATSHLQEPPKRVKSKRPGHILGLSTLAVVLLLMTGFIIHQNMPNIRLSLASSKAGFAASLPTSQPAGYSLGNLDYSTGQVAMHFHSNSQDSRAFTITEQTSNWDSDTLRDMFVANAAENDYQTVETGGNTLYFYGQQNVTWVSGGIWYLVQSSGALSNQQLENIATSL